MITTKFIFIISIMLFGLLLIVHDYFKSKNRKKNILSESVHDKDGIPIIPRHLREISEKEEDKIEEERNDSDSVRFKTLKSVAEQQKASKAELTESEDPVNTDTLISNTNDNIQTYQQITTTNANIEASIETLTEQPSDATISKPLPIPPVSMKANNEQSADHTNNTFKGNFDSLEDDMKIESTEIDFDSTLEEFNSEIGLDDISSITPEEMITNTTMDLDPTDISSHKLHYTSGYYNESDETESITDISIDNNPIFEEESQNIDSAYIDQNKTNIDPATENSVIQIEPKKAVISTVQNGRSLEKNSSIVDNQIQEIAESDQNSPLKNASDNINISILPVDQYSHISGEKLLKMVDDFGFKFGTMNMFHRYQNKDGSGILWFSMMGLTDEGIAPFDLNTLPNNNDFKGLVMFLSLPHPKVLQGFDSMMSIAGLIAREIDGYIVDEDGNEMTTAYKKKLRHLLQSTLDESH